MSEMTSEEHQGQDVKFVDLRFTDPRGKMQHVTMETDMVDETFSPTA
jgi:glutamine synthetase